MCAIYLERHLVFSLRKISEVAEMSDVMQPTRQRGSYRISPRMLKALEALSSGAADTLSQAAEIAGITERAVRYGLQKENVRAWLRAHVQSTFSAGQVAASRTMLSLLRSENGMSQFRAAAWIMGVNGVAPTDSRGPLVQIGIHQAGYIIDTRRAAERKDPISKEDLANLTEVGGLLLGSRRQDEGGH
jgi:hypothetical protein